MPIPSIRKYFNKNFYSRFGNVIESSGSVIPLFKKQISMGGPVTITNENVKVFYDKKEAAEL